MCGIAGILSFKHSVDVSIINIMTDIIVYRGPDDEGAITYNSQENRIFEFKRSEEVPNEFRDSNLLLGHRRLSIIDLSNIGHQPMSYDNDNLWITYNGEIYNYIEIKEELISYGYKFRSKTDTEVILAAYHKWGEDCLYKLNGMWAFSILDRRSNKLFCSVDQFGIKPFYYTKNNEYFSFASEVKQILSLPFTDRKYNNSLISSFGYSTNITDNNTIYSGVFKLSAGEKIVIQLSNTKEDLYLKSRWHRFNTEPTNYNITISKAAEELKELFYDSIKLRLRSDVPVGTALSGGVDSSLIVLAIDKIIKESGENIIQKTFTSGSENKSIDETPYAKEVLEKTNAKGYFVVPNSEGFFRDLELMYYHIEKPFVSSTCYASWSVYDLAKNSGVKVTLDGQGSDEIFAGYDLYMYPYYQADFLFNFNWKTLAYNSEAIRNNYGISKTSQLANILKKYIKTRSFVNEYYDKKRLPHDKFFNRSYLSNISKGIKYHKPERESKGTFARNIEYYLYYSLPQLLNVVDKNSMAHSVEARVPFLDYRILDFVFSLPHDFKIRKGVTKYILKEAFRDELPQNIITRKKEGFNTAENDWFREKHKELKEYVNDNLYLVEDILDKRYVEMLFSKIELEDNMQKRRWDALSLIALSKSLDISSYEV